ncbi:hypothetical protein BN2537_7529 [Streptomyces venezuelae]|nr:hypothetical protein BN2537_7529 [Streptomyces venezuelae]
MHDADGLLAAGDHAGAEIGGEGAVSRSKHRSAPPSAHDY